MYYENEDICKSIMGKHNKLHRPKRRIQKGRKRRFFGKIATFLKPECIELTEIRKVPMLLSEQDKLVCIYKKDKKGIIREVTSVAYTILVGNEWVTVIYYDSTHGGLLHKHTTVSLENRNDIVSSDGVKKKGTQNQLLTWANGDLRKRYLDYRKAFLKRSAAYVKKNGIDIQF